MRFQRTDDLDVEDQAELGRLGVRDRNGDRASRRDGDFDFGGEEGRRGEGRFGFEGAGKDWGGEGVRRNGGGGTYEVRRRRVRERERRRGRR